MENFNLPPFLEGQVSTLVIEGKRYCKKLVKYKIG